MILLFIYIGLALGIGAAFAKVGYEGTLAIVDLLDALLTWVFTGIGKVLRLWRTVYYYKVTLPKLRKRMRGDDYVDRDKALAERLQHTEHKREWQF